MRLVGISIIALNPNDYFDCSKQKLKMNLMIMKRFISYLLSKEQFLNLKIALIALSVH